MTDVQVGDRAKVTIEGEVTDVATHGIRIGGSWIVGNGVPKIEKLADPEPHWANGDIIKVFGYVPAIRMARGGKWVNPHTGGAHPFHDEPQILSAAWAAGKVEYLYRGR